MGEQYIQPAAKGLYTFTSTEKIQMRYGVIANSWEEAKEHMENHNFFKLNNGDHYGGDYMGETEPRRDSLVRKQTCAGEHFTLMRVVKKGFRENATEEVQYANVDHSQHIYIPELDIYDGYSDQTTEQGFDVRVMKIHPHNGLCSTCNNAMRTHNGWSLVPKRESTHTIWGGLFVDEPKELKTHPCGTKSAIFDGDSQ